VGVGDADRLEPDVAVDVGWEVDSPSPTSRTGFTGTTCGPVELCVVEDCWDPDERVVAGGAAGADVASAGGTSGDAGGGLPGSTVAGELADPTEVAAPIAVGKGCEPAGGFPCPTPELARGGRLPGVPALAAGGW